MTTSREQHSEIISGFANMQHLEALCNSRQMLLEAAASSRSSGSARSTAQPRNLQTANVSGHARFRMNLLLTCRALGSSHWRSRKQASSEMPSS